VNWDEISLQVKSVAGLELDDLIDKVTASVLNGNQEQRAIQVLINVLDLPIGEMAIPKVCHALLFLALPDDEIISETLFGLYRKYKTHSYLASQILKILGLMGLKDSANRAEIISLLLRLKPDQDRYLLVAACKVIGRLDSAKPEPLLYAKVLLFLESNDPAVRAEALYQKAFIDLGNALRSSSVSELSRKLQEVRTAFQEASLAEEQRPDAILWMYFLDSILLFLQGRFDTNLALQFQALETTIERFVGQFVNPKGYSTAFERYIAQQILVAFRALLTATKRLANVDEWLDLSTAVIELANLYAQVRGNTSDIIEHLGIRYKFADLSDKVFAASVGPILQKSVNLKRLEQIRVDYEAQENSEITLQGLKLLEDMAKAAILVDFPQGGKLPEKFVRFAEQQGVEPVEMFNEFLEAESPVQWAEKYRLVSTLLYPVSTEISINFELDKLIRPILLEITKILPTYPLLMWERLCQILVFMIHFARFTRNNLPKYVLCKDDGGLGQTASEGDLKEALYHFLSAGAASNGMSYETSKVAGGRVDLSIKFPEVSFPIEVKHEFKSIEPQHIRKVFLAQPDAYASATAQVSLLMVLDLRKQNASGHNNNQKPASGEPKQVFSLYDLSQSFRVESLKPDPDIPNAISNAIIVGLIPGNRPLPSSMATYSKRPISARKKKSI
jgi:hypothetical protein